MPAKSPVTRMSPGILLLHQILPLLELDSPPRPSVLGKGGGGLGIVSIRCVERGNLNGKQEQIAEN